MSDEFNLNRFVDVQDRTYQGALNEILTGKKTGHWIWFVFPQGPFGKSETAIEYSLKSVSAAIAYIQHPILRNRLLEITMAVLKQLKSGIHPGILMGSSTDCQKLASSMTLFSYIAGNQNDGELCNATSQTLDALAPFGWEKCPKTTIWIQNQTNP
jgi:uncharacterized protein (DUF1810 family)